MLLEEFTANWKSHVLSSKIYKPYQDIIVVGVCIEVQEWFRCWGFNYRSFVIELAAVGGAVIVFAGACERVAGMGAHEHEGSEGAIGILLHGKIVRITLYTYDLERYFGKFG